MNTEKLLERVDELATMAAEARRHVRTEHHGTVWLKYEGFYKFKTAATSFILKRFGKEHPYFTEFVEHSSSGTVSNVEIGLGILDAVRDEIRNGCLLTTRGLISADIFGDFMEMAEHLLEENYKDPATVLIGSALEQHLRNLAVAHGVGTIFENRGSITKKKADLLNADLAKAGVYSKIDQKSITAWLGIRNDAAHGHFDNYNKESVQFMLGAVSEFIGRVAI